jgi:hypothetical protein
VDKFFRRRLFQKRVIALAAAYTIALSGLIAGFAGAQTAATQPGGIICHTDIAGQPAPASDGGTDKICNDCCAGCLMLTAALPPPPVTGVAISPSVSEHVVPLAITVLVSSPETKSHRSRAPPLTA